MKSLVFLSIIAFSFDTYGGVFTVPHFVESGSFAIGLEPELTLTHGAGLGANLRYTHGITEFNNLSLFIGTGIGPRRFRLGLDFSFDIFPDVEGQPGIGIAPHLMYYRVKRTLAVDGVEKVDEGGKFEAGLIPYIHKTFSPKKSEVEPFLAIPFGMTFEKDLNDTGSLKAVTEAAVVVGSQFSSSEHFRYTIEIGVAIQNTESYVSGGFSFYY